MSDEQFAKDARMVQADLWTLKSMLEAEANSMGVRPH
jgi:hypothetical protein